MRLLLLVISFCGVPYCCHCGTLDGTNSKNILSLPKLVSTIVLSNYFLNGNPFPDSINRSFRSNHYPFRLVEKVNDSGSTTIIQFISDKNDSVDIFSTNDASPEYVYSISKIICQNYCYYRVLVQEDVVGTDYFILIFPHTGSIYISEKYNYQAIPYKFNEESINLDVKTIEIYYESEEKKEEISFKTYY